MNYKRFILFAINFDRYLETILMSERDCLIWFKRHVDGSYVDVICFFILHARLKKSKQNQYRT